MTTDAPDMSTYVRNFDHCNFAWDKRGDAADFAEFLTAEMGLSQKAMTVDKDGKLYRVFIPLAATYWQPAEGAWDKEYHHLCKVMR